MRQNETNEKSADNQEHGIGATSPTLPREFKVLSSKNLPPRITNNCALRMCPVVGSARDIRSRGRPSYS